MLPPQSSTRLPALTPVLTAVCSEGGLGVASAGSRALHADRIRLPALTAVLTTVCSEGGVAGALAGWAQAGWAELGRQ